MAGSGAAWHITFPSHNQKFHFRRNLPFGYLVGWHLMHATDPISGLHHPSRASAHVLKSINEQFLS
jgi:hypothetical protein